MGQPASTSAATEVLAGLVERVTFQNGENDFCVLRVRARGQRDLITVLGRAAMISAGEFVQASGAWVNTADQVAAKLCIEKAALIRVRAGISYALSDMLLRQFQQHGPARMAPKAVCACARRQASCRIEVRSTTLANAARRLSILPYHSALMRLGCFSSGPSLSRRPASRLRRFLSFAR
jgi:hypothetical protein